MKDKVDTALKVFEKLSNNLKYPLQTNLKIQAQIEKYKYILNTN